MRKVLYSLLIAAVALSLALPALAEDSQSSRNYPQGYYDQGQRGPGMMGGGGYGYGMMGGGGYGYGMMGGRGGYGMMGGGGGYGYGMMGGRGGYGPDSGAWQRLSPEQQKELKASWSKFLKETLPLRQKMAAKHMELVTLWNQPDADPAQLKKLSNEMNDLQAELAKKRDAYQVECRGRFGDVGWACPAGGGW